MSENLITKEDKNTCRDKTVNLLSGETFDPSKTAAPARAGAAKKYTFNIPSQNAPEEEIHAFYKALGVPDDASEYEIEIKDRLIASDPEVNKRLRDLGFTQKQVQAVYDLAVERVVPCIHELACQYEANRQLDRLISHFGGEERWNEISRQLASWGKKNLPEAVYEPLSTTYEGVLALYSMMASGEPVIGKAQGFEGIDDEAALRKLMLTPKYWRDKDPATLKRVTEGFKRLYPS